MAKGIFITATDTGAGKTIVAAGLVYRLRALGCRACYFKPVASGSMCRGGIDTTPDVHFVMQASGLEEDVRLINPWCFTQALSPHLAARLEGRSITMDPIRQALDILKTRYDYIIAEGCGGLAVPLDDNGHLVSDLIRELGFRCVLVARPGLGTLNHTLLSAHFAAAQSLIVKGIIFSNYKASLLEQDNRTTLERLSGLPVLCTLPAIAGADVDGQSLGDLHAVFDAHTDMGRIIHVMEEL